MHVDHRKPVVAFVVLVILAAVVVGFQRADAHTGRFLTSFATVTARAEGGVPLHAGRTGAGQEHLAAVSRAWLAAAPDAGTAADDQLARERGYAGRSEATREADRPDWRRSGAAKDNGGQHADEGRAGTPARPSRSARRALDEAGRDAISRLRGARPGHAARQGLAHSSRSPQWMTGHGRPAHVAPEGLLHPRRSAHGLRGRR